MKTYIRVFARPMGAEPKLFFSPYTAEVECKCESPEECWPWCQPQIEEFETEFAARLWMKEFYPMCYKELKQGDGNWPDGP